MTEDLKKFLYRQLSTVDGLLAIVVSDRDGVPVLKISSEAVPDYAVRPAFLGTFPLAADQAGKLGFGQNKLLVSSYSKFTIVQFNWNPLTVSFVTTNTCNIGLILQLGEELKEHLAGVKRAVTEISKSLFNQS